MSPVHETKLLIRESHLDTFGHVNNATYLEIFEEVRWDIITERGYGLAEIRKQKLGPVILEINLKFKKEVTLRENVTIRTWVTKHEKKITTMRQIILNEKGEEACIADFVISLFDLKERKLVEPTPEWKKALALP